MQCIRCTKMYSVWFVLSGAVDFLMDVVFLMCNHSCEIDVSW